MEAQNAFVQTQGFALVSRDGWSKHAFAPAF